VAGFFGCIVMAVIIGLFLHLPAHHAIAMGALMGVIAQLGDLGKSILKRDVEIKDFGGLFGPHGGVIDRFDGIMYSAPVAYFYLVMMVGSQW
jgi:phosphatidate cytidylyltransferase